MKRVWKCDFCSETNLDSKKIRVHELSCHFNPALKFCYSCKHHDDANFFVCDKKLSIIEGEEKGMCIGWETNDIKILRKVKIQNLIK